MTEITSAAITAAQNKHRRGRYSTVRYCEIRGVPRRLLTLACQLEAVKHLED